jgi:DMSO/TMAO reductase YedYZ molybdopterin-dependent catalytic subunit
MGIRSRAETLREDGRGPSILPPGQHARRNFPRFGTHLHLPPPPVPDAPEIEISGAVHSSFAVPLGRLGDLPRREQVSDLHCVSGWSARGLRWEGVLFSGFWRQFIEPALSADRLATHLVLEGYDGYRVVEPLADALADDVLLVDQLDGQPLTGDHGAPIRFVSPSQYGYVSVKHLARIEVWTKEPPENYGRAHWSGRLMLRPLFWRHPHGRVWHEERNRYLPARLLRVVYAPLRPPIRWLSALGSDARRPKADTTLPRATHEP